MVDRLQSEEDAIFGLDLSGSLDASVGVSGGAQVAFSLLPPDVQSKLQSAAGTFESAAATGAPLLDIASTVSAGKTVTEGQAIAGLSTIATAVGGPIGGAAMAAAGGLVLGIGAGLEQLFTALGLYDHPPEYNYIGLRRTQDPIPYGKTAPDWWHIRSVNDLNNIFQGKLPGHPAVSGYYNNAAYSMLATVLQQLRTPGSEPNWPHNNLNAFEKYFLPILLQDLEAWANGSGFVPTRTLLGQAVSAWNASHGSSPSITYQPVDYGTSGYLNNPIPSMILGAQGDLNMTTLTQSAPISVNLGPSQIATSNPAASAARKLVSILGAVANPSPPTPVTPEAPPAQRVVSMAFHALPAAAPPESAWAKYGPYAPAAVGLALFPLAGVVAPILGGVATLIWKEMKK